MKKMVVYLVELASVCLLLLAPATLEAQAGKETLRTLRGKVVDEDGVPYKYAGIWLRGETTLTDAYGNFEVEYPADCRRYQYYLWFHRADESFFSTSLYFDCQDTARRIVFTVANRNSNGLSQSDVKHMRGYDTKRIIASTGGVHNWGRENGLSAAGARVENTVYIIDGIMLSNPLPSYHSPEIRRRGK